VHLAFRNQINFTGDFMKKLAIALIAAFAFSTFAFATDEHEHKATTTHEDTHAAPTKKGKKGKKMESKTTESTDADGTHKKEHETTTESSH
jgi:hypothetical protein